jgi:hypothetical protein
MTASRLNGIRQTPMLTGTDHKTVNNKLDGMLFVLLACDLLV